MQAIHKLNKNTIKVNLSLGFINTCHAHECQQQGYPDHFEKAETKQTYYKKHS